MTDNGGERSMRVVTDNPAFIRLEAKVDGLITEIREYKTNNDKVYVTRTEFEVFKAVQTPTTKLVADVVKYIIMFVVGASLTMLVSQAG